MSGEWKDDSQTDGKSHSSAAQQLRDTAKWIVGGTFSALVVMLAGTSFSNIGQLFGDEWQTGRIFVFVLGGLIGVAGLVLLTRDALRVLAFNLYSLPQYAFGEFNDPAGSKPGSIGKNRAWFPKVAQTGAERARIAEMRNRVETQLAPYWPERIDTLAQFGQLEQLVQSDSEKQELVGSVLSLFVHRNQIAIRYGDDTVEQFGKTPVWVALEENRKLSVQTRGKSVRYNVAKDGAVSLSPTGVYSIARDDIEWLAKSTYLSANFNMVLIAFNKLRQGLARNIALLVIGFIPMIAAINPPEEPQSDQVVVVTKSDGTWQRTLTTTTAREAEMEKATAAADQSDE